MIDETNSGVGVKRRFHASSSMVLSSTAYVLISESHRVKVRIGSFSSTVRCNIAWIATEGSAILAADHGSKRNLETDEVSEDMSRR
jgi:hypothetical protein